MQELPDNLQDALNDIFENLNNDTKDAMIKHDVLDVNKLYLRIANRLALHLCKFEDIIKHPKALEQFNRRQRLQIILKHHERIQNKSTDDQKLVLAMKIFERREFMWQLADKVSQRYNMPQELAFTLLARSYAQQHGVSFNDLIQHPPAQKFFESGRLLKAKLIYQALKDGEVKQQQSQKNAEVDLDKALDAEVKRLAQQHAFPNAQGLLTKAEVKPFFADPEKLKANVRQVMREEHPDKNPDANKERFRAAAEIKNLMDRGVLEDYLAELERLREQAGKAYNSPRQRP